MQHLVYLHGFLSSPQSQKAQQTVLYAKRHFPGLNVYVPQLPGDINKALRLIDNLLATLPLHQTGFIGSSMGGFLSTYCIETYRVQKLTKANSRGDQLSPTAMPKGVLINPAVTPFNLLRDYIGQQINPYTHEKFSILPQHIAKLKQLYTHTLLQPKCYKVLLQTGDETLDYSLAAKKYAGSRLVIEPGGDHSFVNYEQHLPHIFKFLLTDT